jgi:replicative DNA helicase
MILFLSQPFASFCIGFYIDIVREKYVLRRLISACTRLTTRS